MISHTNFQTCSQTIMDSSDPNISFNERGESDYYVNFINNILPEWNYGKGHTEKLLLLADKIKKDGVGNGFDCIIGVSGGLDSSYLAYVAKEIMGLKPLLFHVDAGWNTNLGVSNIEKLVTGLNVDLFTEVINWEEMKDLQRAFLRSQIPDQDLPQDIAFFSGLYRFAKKHKIRHVLTGGNHSTESCKEPDEWGAYPGIDKKFIFDIYKKYGNKKINTFPVVDILDYKIYYNFILGIRVHKPLNMLPYIKAEAENLLEKKFGWEKFKHKHHESRFTRFFEDFWLPQKFGYDRRKVHFSSLILSGQMDRDEALLRIQKPEMNSIELKNEFEYIADKLDFSPQELKLILEGDNKTYRNYNNKRYIIDLGARTLRFLGIEKRLFR